MAREPAVCQALGIEQPIVQAPLATVPRLTAAVSIPDALGMVTLTWSDDAGAVVRQTGGDDDAAARRQLYSPKITTALLTSFLTAR